MPSRSSKPLLRDGPRQVGGNPKPNAASPSGYCPRKRRNCKGVKDLPMSAQTRKRKDDPRTLKGRVALVTGGSRGAGRAIAAVLGEHGATVYVTGRSVRGQPTTDNLPGTIEKSAEEVTRRGGQGIALRCDHA